jgi:hypothetical protein
VPQSAAQKKAEEEAKRLEAQAAALRAQAEAERAKAAAEFYRAQAAALQPPAPTPAPTPPPPPTPAKKKTWLGQQVNIISEDMRHAKENADSRLRLLSVFFLAMAVASVALPFLAPEVVRGIAFVVVVVPGVLTLHLMNVHQMRFNTTAAARKLGIILARPAAVWAGVIGVASFFLIWELIPLSWAILFFTYQWARFAPIWPIEIRRGEVWFHHYHFRPADQGELRAYPQPPLDRFLTEPLKALGLYQLTRDYLFYDYPDFLYTQLHEEWAKAFRNPTNAGSVGQLVAQLNAAATPDPYDVLAALIRQVEAHKTPPFLWIHPPDTLRLAWLQNKPVPVVAKVEHIFTSEGLPLDVEITFSVLADPSSSGVMMPRQIAANAVANPKQVWAILPHDARDGLQPSLLTHLRAALSGAFAAAASGVARSVLGAKALAAAFSEAGLSELRKRIADQDLEALERQWGASVQKFSVMATPVVPERILDALWDAQTAPFEARTEAAELENYMAMISRLGLPEALREQMKAQLLLMRAMGKQPSHVAGKGKGGPEIPSIFSVYSQQTQAGLPSPTPTPPPPKPADPPIHTPSEQKTPPHGTRVPPPPPSGTVPLPPSVPQAKAPPATPANDDNFLWIPLERRKGGGYRAPGAPPDDDE